MDGKICLFLNNYFRNSWNISLELNKKGQPILYFLFAPSYSLLSIFASTHSPQRFITPLLAILVVVDSPDFN